MTSKFIEITTSYVPLAFTTFGGPAAHVALFLDKFCKEKGWLSEKTFAELFAISQSLPGPASTQLAYAIALIRAGPLLAIYSFFVWSLPCAIIMTAIAIGVQSISNLPPIAQAVQNGLTSAAVGLIALAAYKLTQKVIKTPLEQILTLFAASMAISFSYPWLLPVLMLFGGLVSVSYDFIVSRIQQRKKMDPAVVQELAPQTSETETENLDVEIHTTYSAKVAGFIFLGWLSLFGIALGIRTLNARAAQILGTFYYTGSVIFGGGPVVIPLLAQYTVQTGWLSEQEFLIGLAIINALPGPMFNFAAFLGALSLRNSVGESILGAFLAYLGIFMPGLLLQSALIPVWNKYRKYNFVKIFFAGVNASAVGLIYASVYILCLRAIVGKAPTAIAIISYPIFVIIASATFVGVGFLKVPAPIVIFLGGLAGLASFYSTI